MNFTDYRPSFDRDGYVIVRPFLPPADFAELTRNLDRYIREVVPTLPDSDAFYVDRARPETLKQMQHMGGDPYFRDYTRNSTWSALARALLGEEAEVQEPEWFNKPPGTISPTPPHQDNYYFCLKPPSVLTIWLALDPVDEQNGCLRYVVGSHQRGIRPHGRSSILGFSQGITDYGPEDQAREVQIHLQPGDAVVHHGNTIHRAEPNGSATRNRRAFAMVFKGNSCKRDEEAFARYLAALKTQHETMGLKT
jgi:phytanoyl-CoA hydroxylase